MKVTNAQGGLVGIKEEDSPRIKRIGSMIDILVEVRQAENLSNCWFVWVEKDENGNDKSRMLPMNDIIRYGEKRNGNYYLKG